jgi:hypothetical protein
MKFEIVRASDNFRKDSDKPCEGAWLENDAWWIEIPDLASLIALSKSVGRDVIVNDSSIRIYDDYIE